MLNCSKPDVLIEALPWIQKFTGAVVVIKYGGNAMVSDELREKFAEDIVFLKTVGINPVVVHGGGPQISSMLAKLGIESEFRGGFRVTTEEAMDVVRMVLTGKISRELVGLINAKATKSSGFAIGMSGEDGQLFKATRKIGKGDLGESVDLGLVGEISSVDPSSVIDLLNSGRIPVISSVAPDQNDPNTVLNINADLAASALARALKAQKLVILTDVEGLYENYPDKATLVSKIGTRKLETMLNELESGMIPKMTACLEAVNTDVAEAHIIDGREPHSLLQEIFTNSGVGTLVVQGDDFELKSTKED